MNEPIHVAVVRTVKPGCEKAFEQALQEFFQASFAHGGVLGATMIVPPPGSDSRERGILRTFAGEKERDAFYQSAMFKSWEQKAVTLTEGESVDRQMHGLEAWFRSSGSPPPRWKMAVATFLGVFPTATILSLTLGQMTKAWPFILGSTVFNVCMVALLTWFVMPLITRFLHHWLHSNETNK